MTTILNPQQTGYKAHAIQRGETFSVAHSTLRPKPGFNERRAFHGIAELADRIRLNGFRKTTPLTVEWNKELGIFDVIHGERRVRAVKLLVEQGHDPGPIWCMSESRDTTPLQQLLDQLLTNTGEPFTPLEKGFLYLRIQQESADTTATEIAARVGETKQAVSVALRLAKHGSNALHAAIQDDRISSTTADSILKDAGEDHAAQDQLLAETLAAADQTGSTHATPKHLPRKQKSQGVADSDPPSSPTDNVIIPDADDDEEEDDSTQDSGTPFAGNENAPADPGAYERLKNSPSASEGISNSDSFGKGGDPKIDGRIRKINDALEELNKENCHTDRWDTIELLLTYLDGKGTIAVVKNHLLGK